MLHHLLIFLDVGLLHYPKQDTEKKIALLKPYGLVLDTCMGMGYTAILAAESAKKVFTFEIDENVFSLAQINPCSQLLFSLANIEVNQQDLTQRLSGFADQYFDCIIHDPPTFKLAPDLYSLSFYQQLLRIIKKGGKLFHYTPLYLIKRGYDFPAKIKAKLTQAGFRVGQFSPDASGFLCRRPKRV